MPAPTFTNGLKRSVAVVGVPSVVLLVVVSYVGDLRGPRAAGVLYLAGTVLILYKVVSAATYWNVRYTLGYSIGGPPIWFVVPNVMSELVPRPYALAGGVLALCSVLVVAAKIPRKL